MEFIFASKSPLRQDKAILKSKEFQSLTVKGVILLTISHLSLDLYRRGAVAEFFFPGALVKFHVGVFAQPPVQFGAQYAHAMNANNFDYTRRNGVFEGFPERLQLQFQHVRAAHLRVVVG